MRISVSSLSLQEVLQNLRNKNNVSGVEVNFIDDVEKFKTWCEVGSHYDPVLVTEGNSGYLLTTVFGDRLDAPITR